MQSFAGGPQSQPKIFQRSRSCDFFRNGISTSPMLHVAELHVLLRSQLSRPKAVCLHGFRSNGDALAAQMGTLVSLSAPVLRCFDGAQRASLKAAKVVQRTPLLGLDLKQQGAFSEMICEIQFCYNF